MLKSRRLSILTLFTSLILSAGIYGTMVQTTDERIANLEERVLRLEATVAVLVEAGSALPLESSAIHKVSGVYIDQPRQVRGQTCASFYPAGTIVFLSDWEGNVLSTGELMEGNLIADGLCSQPFVFDNVPEVSGYTVNLERRVAGSAYEFSLSKMQMSDWHIEVISRYNQ